ncbi:MAG: T9SS type A sorting domain-containing protein, partial [Ekhidna sp.]|nr:T9SS type A sorting domain-containing protein [Ekhidna sp.]
GVWSLYQAQSFTVTNGPLSNDGFVDTLEDEAVSFAESDFNYSSSGGTTFSRVAVSSLPINGNLMLNDVAVSVDQEIPVADIPNLRYDPDTNFNGEDTFEFTVGDATNLSVASSTMTITVAPVNDAPAFTLSGDVTVEQDFTTTSTVTVTAATVPVDEADQVVAYSIDPTAVAFANVSIDATTGTVSITSVAGEFGSQEFTVTADDGQAENNTAAQVFTLTVNPSNQPPIFEDATFELAENATQGSLVGTLSATDPEGETVTYSITAGNELGGFTLNSTSGSLNVNDGSVLDFEVNPVFVLTVEASDGEVTSLAEVIVNITDQPEAPIVADETFTIVENSATGTVVGTVTGSDPDGDALTYSITAGNDLGGFAIDAITGELTVADVAVIDFEQTPVFTLTVAASDGQLSGTGTVTVNLTDVDDNAAPVIADQSFDLPENSAAGTQVGTVVASDPESSTLTYSVTAGNDAGAFSIDGSSGLLSVVDDSTLDFEVTPSIELTVSVSDGDLSSEALIIINLSDVNESPAIESQAFSIAENADDGSSVGSVSATDPDGEALSFSITSGNDAGGFTIDSSTGLITVNDARVLDFETSPNFNLLVEVTDGSFVVSALMSVTLSDVAEAPAVDSQTFEIAENSDEGTSVGTVVATDPEGDQISFAVTAGNDAGGFTINAATGELTVADASVLDFETTPEFALTVQVSDGSLTASATITIVLTDVDENRAPEISDQSFDIPENSANGTSVGSVVAADPDGDDITFSITAGNTSGGFDINTTTGEITVADGGVLDFEEIQSFVLTVEVTDGAKSGEAEITINLTDEDDALGIQEVGILIYPNPTGGVINISYQSDFDLVSITDLSGKEVQYELSNGTSGVLTIDLETLDRGVYFVNLLVDQERKTFKISKNN